MAFEPIAIIGCACVLPEALTPAELWKLVLEGRSAIGTAPAGRWRVDRGAVMGTPEAYSDRTWSDAGGYVRGFDAIFDPQGFRIPSDQIRALDPLFQWVLHGAREALRQSGRDTSSHAGEGDPRAGLIIGNLSFPSSSMAKYAESVWLGRIERPHPRNRFMSGLPARLAADALGFRGEAFSLDAACASSLYAIKLACDRLQDRDADLMIAGAVNCADDLFIHIGFCALAAMSKTGRSRPFHRDADGLVPSEGAGFVVLKRLADAHSAQDRVLGVIRGIGLSNDGRGRGLLVPSAEGQVRSMRAAYASSGLRPLDVSLIECHATGTSVGDAVELESMNAVFAGAEGLPIGSLKANLGHSITAAGVAGLIKVLSAMQAGVRPPTPRVDAPLAALAGSPFRLIERAEPWESEGPRRAAVSAFGFGGNNAHLIVEEDGPDVVPPRSRVSVPRAPLAIVGIGARVGNGNDATSFAAALFGDPQGAGPRREIAVALAGMRTPPKDLELTLPQQLLVLEAAREATVGLRLEGMRTGVLVGMGCEAEIARHGARWRAQAQSEPAVLKPGFGPKLESAGVVGTMPNIAANRINNQLDLRGLGFAVSAEELSGVVALRLAARALRSGELDAVVVAAVDLSHEPVHLKALAALGVDRAPADAAVALVVKRLDDALRDGDEVMAVLAEDRAGLRIDATGRIGWPHAASGLLDVAAATLAVRHGAQPGPGRASPWLGERIAVTETRSFAGSSGGVTLLGAGAPFPLALDEAPRLFTYCGADATDVVARLRRGSTGGDGPARLAIVATRSEVAAKEARAARCLELGEPFQEGVAFHGHPIRGELAWVFTGAAAAYAGMGRELLFALPELGTRLAARSSEMSAALGRAGGRGEPLRGLEQLWACSALCQVHAELSQMLGLVPAATLGLSSGESNALFATGAWRDVDAFVRDTRASPLFSNELLGERSAVRRAWNDGSLEVAWSVVAIAAPVAVVREALANEPRVHLTIVCAPDECVIAGAADGVARVVARIGVGDAGSTHYAMDYDMVVHCPEVEQVRTEWSQLHRREVYPVPGVRFYTANGGWYHASPDSAADAITGQAVRTLDFVGVVEQAWADGVRIFVEHGPKSLCSGWIRRILGEREHLAVSFDAAGRSGVRQVLNSVAALWSAGVEVDVDALNERLHMPLRAAFAGPVLTVAAHAPEIRLPPPSIPQVQVMAPAPALPPVLEDMQAHHAPRPESGVSLAAAAAYRPGHAVVLAKANAFRAQVAAVHQEFLQQQAGAHQRFLALRESGLAMLTAAYAQAAASLPQPAVSRQAAKLEDPKPASARLAILPGPKFDRAQLEVLAGGRISSVFGPDFEGQDAWRRQVRMPEPPLLLADRVTGIQAVPRSMGSGTLWTETDVPADAWYLHEGRMPCGIHIESGQADLLLISWLGVDFFNRGERVYRLLGCELTWHEAPGRGVLPEIGDTLTYDIHVDGHAAQGAVRLFFFHYDCRIAGALRLSVRNGQAGFFTDDELRDSGGVLWEAATAEHAASARLDPPAIDCTKHAFTRLDIEALAAGRADRCFGAGFEPAAAHVRTPSIQGGRMLFLDAITEFDPRGGPWRRGYLRAETPIHADDWYFAGHFKNDPCMPGTLMFEGCVQAMAFYLAAMGFTLERDGWRFEPVPDEKFLMRCRGQVTPDSRLLVYEVFVDEVIAGPVPTLFADLLCSVDGVKAFHARRVGLRLVPGWPLDTWKQRPLAAPVRVHGGNGDLDLPALGGLRGISDPEAVAVSPEGMRFGHASLLACAWGRPSDAFGSVYARFDSTRRVARLPGPPYLFMSRIARLEAEPALLKSGGAVEVEYDIPREVWYFDENGHPTMPFCVLMEAALQPCGWLASYAGSALSSDEDLQFRNLDGSATQHAELLPGSAALRTVVRFAGVSRSAGMIIESFDVECFQGARRVYEMKTVFGFFPQAAFENQAGLPATDEDRRWILAPAPYYLGLRERPAKYCSGSPRLANPMLLMLDRITAFEPAGGRAGLGRVRGEKDVDPGEWFFKAHFFQDPVQPGSLGIEALTQLLQWWMIERGLGEGIRDARFEPLMLGRKLTWKYRGQVVPSNRLITTELEVVETGEDAGGRFAVADAHLWVDGIRIYSAKDLGMRIVAGDTRGEGEATAPVQFPEETLHEEIVDPGTDPWLADHCPTWTVPALPMMSMLDRLVACGSAATGRPVIAVENVRLQRWLVLPGPVRIQTRYRDGEATLAAWREARNAALSRFEPVATGTLHFASLNGSDFGPAPAALAPLCDAVNVGSPYEDGSLFHGESFRYLTSLRIGAEGASATLDASRGSVPHGFLHQGVLDAMTHAIPHDSLQRWSTDIAADQVAYPYRIARIRFFAPIPAQGLLRLEVRFAGFDDDRRHPQFDLQLIADAVLVEMRLVEVLLPKGPIGMAPARERRAFLRDRRFVRGVGLSRHDAGTTELSAADVRESDWLPGNVERIYAIDPGSDPVLQVAIKDHVAVRALSHPSRIRTAADAASAVAAIRPLRRYPVRVSREADRVRITDAAPSFMDLAAVRDYWADSFHISRWPIEDLYLGLIERFVGDVIVADPDEFAKLRGKSALYVANHQVGIESLLFSVLASALSFTSTMTLAKAEHRETWLGSLIAHGFAFPGVADPKVIAFFERSDSGSLIRIIDALAAEIRGTGKNLMVHVDGTRSLRCRTPVKEIAGSFIDMALAIDLPIVPVRFARGLPVDALAERLDFPLGYCRQDYWIGRPIFADELRALPLRDRKQAILGAINGLGPNLEEETPATADPEFAALVEDWVARTGATTAHAVLYATLAALPNPGEMVSRMLEGARSGRLVLGDGPADRWLAGFSRPLFGPRGPRVG